MSTVMPSLSVQDYHIGIICALKHELAAVEAMLDEEHESTILKHSRDENSYSLGRIHKHNVVVACLPYGRYGVASAATVAKDMMHTFSHVRYGLLVGIGGGIPGDSTENDVRLGDVVVSQPEGNHGGVIQYDMGKSLSNGIFEHKGTLQAPPSALLIALSRLQARHERVDSQIPIYLNQMITRYPKMARVGYQFPGIEKDNLYTIDYEHASSVGNCRGCDSRRSISRQSRPSNHPEIHYGVIASGNQIVKDSTKRDALRKDFNAVCCEMEAAGLANSFPCLVIRGICDYADSHKNDTWQRYAAATAAAYAKEYLLYLSAEETQQALPVQDVIKNIDELRQAVHSQSSQQNEFQQTAELRYENQEHRECHQAFKKSNYEEEKDRNPLREPGTCQWVLRHDMFHKWLHNDRDDLLWISADPGCGKSVLSRSLVDKDLLEGVFEVDHKPVVCYYFFKDNQDQSRLAAALCAVLHQLFSKNPKLIPFAIKSWKANGNKVQEEPQELWRILRTVCGSVQARHVICVIDALDECEEDDRKRLMHMLRQFCTESSHSTIEPRSLKFLITSRPYSDIESEFRKLVSSLPSIHLRGEDKNDQIREEIDIVVQKRVSEIAKTEQLADNITNSIRHKLMSMQNRTYLWLHLALDTIPLMIKNSLYLKPELFKSIPTTVDEAYEQILGRVHTDLRQRVKKILLIIVGAPRPLTLEEMTLALDMAMSTTSYRSLSDFEIDTQQLEKNLRQWCGLFIFLRHRNIYLIHQTAKEFLLRTNADEQIQKGYWRHCLSPTDVDVEMSRIMMQYLCLHEFDKKDPKLDRHIIKNRAYYRVRPGRAAASKSKSGTAHHFTFFMLSAENWPRVWRRIQHTSAHNMQRELALLYDDKSRRYLRWTNAAHLDILSSLTSPTDLTPALPQLHVAAYNGHTKLMKRMLDCGPEHIVNSRDALDHTPLDRAASAGYSDTILFLMENGALFLPCGLSKEDVMKSGRPAIIAAAERGHKGIVDLLISLGAFINEVDAKGRTALIAAVEECHLKVVKLLVDRGADVNKKARFHGTALTAAASGGLKDVVQVLIERGADMSEAAEFHGTALMAAANRGFGDIVQLLVERGADVSATVELYGSALMAAASAGFTDIVQLLIRAGAAVSQMTEYDGTALMAAARNGHKEVIECLIASGADVNQGGEYCGNALIKATKYGHQEIVQLLIASAADLNQNGRHDTALIRATEEGHDEVMKLLIEAGADVNQVGHCGDTALTSAVRKDEVELVQLLIESGADINQIPAPGGAGTALVVAAESDNTSIVEFLINRGADVNNPSVDSSPTALHETAYRSSVDLSEMLIDFGANVNIWSTRDGTALEVAAASGDAYHVNFLISRGADVNLGGGMCHSPLYVAVANGHEEVVKLLIEHGAAVSIHDMWGRNPVGRGRWIHERALEHQEEGLCTDALCTLCSVDLDAILRVIDLLVEHGAVDNSREFDANLDGYSHLGPDCELDIEFAAVGKLEIYDAERLLYSHTPKSSEYDVELGLESESGDEIDGESTDGDRPAKRIKRTGSNGKFRLVKRLKACSMTSVLADETGDVVVVDDGDGDGDGQALRRRCDPATEYMWYELVRRPRIKSWSGRT